MELEPESIMQLSSEQFRRFGIACCKRLGCGQADRRLAKALRRLEQSLGPPMNEDWRRDALNAAQSVYQELGSGPGEMTAEAAIACTLVCACEDRPNLNLLGNFECALAQAEALSLADIRRLERDLYNEVTGLGAGAVS